MSGSFMIGIWQMCATRRTGAVASAPHPRGRTLCSRLWLLALVALVPFGAARAEDYPQHAIRLIVPWPAGGNTDAVSRQLASGLGTKLGVAVIVENRSGANGQIGAGIVAHASPDGYTLLVASAETHSIIGGLHNLPYDPIKDFQPIGSFALNPFMLAGRATLPAKTTQELVAYMRANPGKLTYGSWGIGSTGHIAMEMFKAQAGVDALHVPFQGSAPSETALLGGQIDLMVMPVGRAVVVQHSGRVRIFNAMTAASTPLMPDVPSLAEVGYKNVDAANWFGIMAPAKTPARVVERIGTALTATLASPDTQSAFKALGVETFALSESVFQTFIHSEMTRWTEAVAHANIHLQN
jgi:tripartite-type tricarboxylate transporter receptor subunit TctC